MNDDNKKEMLKFAEKQKTFAKDRAGMQLAYGMGASIFAVVILLLHYTGIMNIPNTLYRYILICVVVIGGAGSLIGILVKRIYHK